MNCGGECNKEGICSGVVHRVCVTGHGWVKPWYFYYCDTAVKIDRENGFVVTLVNEFPDELPITTDDEDELPNM